MNVRLIAVVILSIPHKIRLDLFIHINRIELADRLGYRLPSCAVRISSTTSGKVHCGRTSEVLKLEVMAQGGEVSERFH